jgi:hypothetical protein
MAEGLDSSGHATSIRLIDSNGTPVRSWALKSGVQVLAAAGHRIFVDSAGELKAIDSDGTVEDLGPFGQYGWTFVARSDGHRWGWVTPGWAGEGTSDIHIGGDGIAARVFRVTPLPPIDLVEWTPQGLLLRVGAGVGDYWPFGIWLGSGFYLLNPDTGVRTQITVPGECSVTDIAANGAYVCLTGTGGDSARVVWPDGTAANVALPKPAFNRPGAVAFDPSGSTVSIGGATGAGNCQQPCSYGTGEEYATALLSRNGTLQIFGPAQARPAFGATTPARQSWLSDGRFLMWRPSGASGGPSGLYWVTPAGASTFTADGGYPVGVLTPG